MHNFVLGAERVEENRRKWERIPIVIPLFVSGTDSEGERFSDLTSAQNIGAGGVLFASHRSLAPTAKLTIQVPFAPWLSKLAAAARNSRMHKGRVVRVLATKTFNYYAFQFDRPLIETRSQDKILRTCQKPIVLSSGSSRD